MRSDVFKKQIRLIGNNQNTVIEAVPFESIWGFIVLIFWTVLIFGFSGFAFLVVAFMDIAVVVKIVVGFLGLSLIAFFVGLILKMLESERIVIKLSLIHI